jgi:alpha-tubulin suppressor-like RCC1 family protein
MSRSTRRTARGATITLWVAGAVLTGVSCRGDEATEPTKSDASELRATLATTTVPLAFRQISAGSFHTCGVTSDDKAYCWGNGESGQLGQGQTSGPSFTPVPVQGGLRFKTISGGVNYTCGLTTAGQAYCWGANSFGGVGDGTRTARVLPTPVLGGRRFRQLDTGGFHTCGLTDPDRKLYCWGANRYGQLGDGTKTTRTRPVAVFGGRVFRQVSGGSYHTCAVTPTNQTYCWGDNLYGQLGDGTQVARSRPVLVAGHHLFRQVDGGGSHSCATTTTYLAFCWGIGANGVLGDGIGSGFSQLTPRAVAGGLSFARVSTGLAHSCAETTRNRVFCWGDNTRGQLGDGTTLQRNVPTAVAGALAFAQVSASGSGLYTCGKDNAGLTFCWGLNSAGQLGIGTNIGPEICQNNSVDEPCSTKPAAVVGPS